MGARPKQLPRERTRAPQGACGGGGERVGAGTQAGAVRHDNGTHSTPSPGPFQKPFGMGGAWAGAANHRAALRLRKGAFADSVLGVGVQGRAGLGSRREPSARVADDLRKQGPPSGAQLGSRPGGAAAAAAAWEGAARQRLVRTPRRPGPRGRAGESILQAPTASFSGPCLVASPVRRRPRTSPRPQARTRPRPRPVFRGHACQGPSVLPSRAPSCGPRSRQVHCGPRASSWRPGMTPARGQCCPLRKRAALGDSEASVTEVCKRGRRAP